MDIIGNSGTTTNAGGAYFTTSNWNSTNYILSTYDANATTYSLKTTNNIISGKNFYSLSDRRIKKNIEEINDSNALIAINKIEPKSYHYIDNVVRTSSNVLGFIAQQIRDVIPDAVKLQNEYIPNIYQLAPINSNIIYLYTSNVLITSNFISSNLLLITRNDEKIETSILDMQLNSINSSNSSNIYEITIDNHHLIQETDLIFVYGIKVNDLHILDKSYIYTLNVCAIQDLNKNVNDIINTNETINNILDNLIDKTNH
jgi:hypothetical protein